MELSFEPDGASDGGPCPDCGHPLRVVWGFVRAWDEPHAVYFAQWTPAHPQASAAILLSLGPWAEDADERDRRAIGIDCRPGPAEPICTFIDAAALPWNDPSLGSRLAGTQAAASTYAADALTIAQALIENEPRLRAHLSRSRR
jgi:hypothetical protein